MPQNTFVGARTHWGAYALSQTYSLLRGGTGGDVRGPTYKGREGKGRGLYF